MRVLISFPSSSSSLVRQCQVSVVLSAITAPNSSSRLCVECVHVRTYVCTVHALLDAELSQLYHEMRIIIWRPLHKFIQNHLLMISSLTLLNFEKKTISMPALYSSVCMFLCALKLNSENKNPLNSLC